MLKRVLIAGCLGGCLIHGTPAVAGAPGRRPPPPPGGGGGARAHATPA